MRNGIFLFEYTGIYSVFRYVTSYLSFWYLVVLQIFQFELIFILNLDHHFTINLELDTTRVYTMEHGTTGYAMYT